MAPGTVQTEVGKVAAEKTAARVANRFRSVEGRE